MKTLLLPLYRFNLPEYLWRQKRRWKNGVNKPAFRQIKGQYDLSEMETQTENKTIFNHTNPMRTPERRKPSPVMLNYSSGRQSDRAHEQWFIQDLSQPGPPEKETQIENILKFKKFFIMKTKLELFRWILLLLLIAGVGGAWAQGPGGLTSQSPTQTVCIGNQPYAVDPSPVPGALYNWSISGGTAADWQINGSGNEITIDWKTAGVYTLSVFTYTVLSCPGPTQSVIVTVSPNLPVSVSIAADKNNVCTGTSITYTATPTNGGTTPVYAWYVNGAVQTGQTGATFSYVAANADAVYATLTSNATCATGSPATSNTITMTISPLPVTSPIWHN